MNNEGRSQPVLNRLRSVKRASIRLSPATLVRADYFDPDRKFPLVVQPNVEKLRLAEWAATEREFLEAELLKHGAILFRDFSSASVSEFERFARAVSSELLDYRERAAPRTEVGGRVYTSTEYPADQRIPLHHEMSYSHNWPAKIWFLCVEPARQGGRTPIADDRKVFNLIDPEIREVFTRKKVMYVRNYGEGVDLPWQEVFQTCDRSAVEEYCRNSRTEFEWRGNDRLRTRSIRQAVVTHPKTGDTVWFNHAHMFHSSNLEPAVREALLSEFSEDELPRNAFYGDGTPIEAAVLDEIKRVYDEAATAFTWQRGDILMLDNFLASHGREPYSGPRRVLVTMAELYTSEH